MFMKEICEACHLTKKAVEYYEQQGFIHPDVMENGYRSYGESELSTLKEISVLRKCGLGIHDIRTVLESTDKASALSRCKYLSQLKMRKLAAAQHCLDNLIGDYDVNKAFDDVQRFDDSMYTVQEKIVLAFPGSYGIYVSLHFGRFLNEPIQTDEQRIAYQKIVAYLDNLKLIMPDELGAYLEDALKAIESAGIERIEAAAHSAMEEAIRNPDALLENESTAAYVEYRLSDEYKSSPAGRLTALMVDFQRSSGYQEQFIENLKKLSPAYQNYCDEMAVVNAALLKKYPEVENFYEM
ncbi:MerR family transcriptional regulator [Ruminococcaceae bacterium OttesenSCG-928-L11]|nr:MerR family transcriptional regulator [Ruminococcaceae bacterium OttesenSCG-928-L11]